MEYLNYSQTNQMVLGLGNKLTERENRMNTKIDKIEYDNPMKIHLMEELRVYGQVPTVEEQLEYNISKKDIFNVNKGNGRFKSGIETYQFSLVNGEVMIHRIG